MSEKIWAKAAKVGGATKAAEQQCMQQQKTASVSSKSSFKKAVLPSVVGADHGVKKDLFEPSIKIAFESLYFLSH